jgi:hypothetical protein
MSFFPPRWRNKIRRRFYSPYNKLGGLEISAKIAEYPELKNFMSGAAAIKPDIFIDVGANFGLYTCILLKNRLVPRAILFEKRARRRAHS